MIDTVAAMGPKVLYLYDRFYAAAAYEMKNNVIYVKLNQQMIAYLHATCIRLLVHEE